MISPEVTIFLLVWGGGNFPNKMAKYGNFETELERVNKQLNVYYATYMCKKGLFLPHKSDGNAVFVFLVHFPEVQSLVEIS